MTEEDKIYDEKRYSAFVEIVAKVCHEVNRHYCIVNSLPHNLHWEDEEEHIRESCRIGVDSILDEPGKTPEESHKEWMKTKIEQGWVYGKVLNKEKKIHNLLKPYKDIPIMHQVKDSIFQSVVQGMRSLSIRIHETSASFLLPITVDKRAADY